MSSERTSTRGRLGLLLRVAVVFVSVAAIWLLVLGVSDQFFGTAYEDRLGHALRAGAISVLVIPTVYLACRYLDRREWSDLRLTSLREGWRPLVFGMIFWVVAAGIGAIVALSLGWTSISFGTPSAGILLLLLYLPALVFLYEAFPEELIFRGYFYRNLSENFPVWISVVGQAALFTLWGAAIGAAGSVDRVILFFTFSITLGVLRVITGNLWASIGFHMTFQYFTQFLSAAITGGFIQMEGRGNFELLAFWFFPIILGAIVLLVGRRVITRNARQTTDSETTKSRSA